MMLKTNLIFNKSKKYLATPAENFASKFIYSTLIFCKMEAQIISLIERKGPVVPADLSKELKLDSTFAGAYLSDLVKSKKLIISSLKVGTSPVYYLPKQKEQLENLSKHLSEKDRRAYDFLRDKKVLRDSKLYPLMQVAMREIKDFAIPLKVNNSEIFWKYYLLSDETAIAQIKNILDLENAPKEKINETIPQRVQDFVKELAKGNLNPAIKEEVQEEKIIEKEKPHIKKEHKPSVYEHQDSILKEEFEKEIRAKLKKELEEEKDKIRKLIKEELKSELVRKEKKPVETVSVQDTLRKLEPEEIEDIYFQKVFKKFDSLKMNMDEIEIVSKNKEYDLVTDIPSPIGTLRYFCKIHNKPKVSDGDLSNAYLKGLQKNLPTLFVSNGTLSKKSEKMIGKEFKNLVWMKI